METQEIRHPAHQIMSLVARYYGITVEEMKNGDRHQRLVRARHVAMYLLRHRQKMSFPEIASVIGRRDHTTAMAAIRKIKDHLEQDTELRRDLFHITKELAHSSSSWENLSLLRPMAQADDREIRCNCRGLAIKPNVDLCYRLKRTGHDTIISLEFLKGTRYALEFTDGLRPELLPISAIDISAFSGTNGTPWEDIVLNSILRLLTQCGELYLSFHTCGADAAFVVATLHCGEFFTRGRCPPHELEQYLRYD